jgi:hypothetical protein
MARNFLYQKNYNKPFVWYDCWVNLYRHMYILQVVNDTSSQTQRCSVPAARDIPFQEMTSHCEAISMGKHHKMSVLMSFKHSRQASIVTNYQVNHIEAGYASNKQVRINLISSSQFTFHRCIIINRDRKISRYGLAGMEADYCRFVFRTRRTRSSSRSWMATRRA